MAPIRHTLVVGDLSQIELRGTLALACDLWEQLGVKQTTEEARALQLLKGGGDLYGDFGSKIYERTITKEETPLERQIAKSAVLGLGFGMGKDKFVAYCKASNIAINEELATYIVKLYRTTYQGVVRLWKYLQEQLRSYIGYPRRLQLFKEPEIWFHEEPLFGDAAIRLPGGLFIKYPGLNFDGATNEFGYIQAKGPVKLFGGKILENIVQASARQIVMEMTVQISQRYKVLMSTHDEIVCAVPSSELDPSVAAAGREFVEEVMTVTPDWWPSLPVGAEVKSSHRYGNAK
jgi:DNA polymerase